MPETARYTVAEVLRFPDDGKRYELIGGELLVSPAPAPRHQAALGRLFRVLGDYLTALGREGTLFTAPADITWDDETLVQPDLLVVPPEEVTNDWNSYKTLLLAVEILSPTSGRADRVLKRRLYQERKVATYWIVDHGAGLVEVWRPDDERPAVVSDQLTWRLEPGAPELAIGLGSLFAGLPG
ncbi:MAG: Uma2 family endonuclease [Gemmatimonadales bacterium]